MRTTLEGFGGVVTGKAFARAVLAFILALLLAFLGLGTPAFDPASTVIAQESPSPSPTGPTGPTINLLNPAQGYDPGTLKPPRPPGTPDRPKISDRFDGVDTAYHLQAWTSQNMLGAVVEASITYPTGNEITIGTLSPVSGLPNHWELFWDIPDTFAEGNATITVRLYRQVGNELEQLSEDEQAVDMQHRGEAAPAPPQGTQPADETVEFLWPTQNGPLGFFKSSVGLWRTLLDVRVSSHTSEIDFLYSISDPGSEPEFVQCGHFNAFTQDSFADEPFEFQTTCQLLGKTLPTDVTAIAAVPLEGDKPDREDVFDSDELTQEAADVHRLAPYIQQPGEMKIKIVPTHHATRSASYPTGKRRTAKSDCLELDLIVTDRLDRPVQGANVDVHIQGPNDQMGFAVEQTDNFETHGVSRHKTPDGGAHRNESAYDCTNFLNIVDDGEGTPEGEQGDHNIPGAADLKHRESTLGTGMSGPDDMRGNEQGAIPGLWRFALFSHDPGITDITAWVDEEPTPGDLSKARAKDDDMPEPGEPTATEFAQWFPSPLSLSFAPAGNSSTPGQCVPFTIRARAGSRVVSGINVDVHATGPNNDLDFCDPPSASLRRAPDDADSEHTAEDPGESIHIGPPPEVQHTEGETDDQGNFLVGLTSPVTGDTTLEAWVDDEPGQDNDVFGTGEVRAAATINWLASLADAQLSFINPSPYGAGTSGAGTGTRVSNTRDADTQYHIVVRVDAIGVPAVELLTSTDGTNFSRIGDMTQIGTSDLWEFYWNVDAADDSSPTLRAQIPGTDRKEDITIQVNTAGGATSRAWETAEIVSPIDGTLVAFNEGATEIRGKASAGAEGIELYYTKAPAKDTPQGADWFFCGYVDLDGTGDEPQDFRGNCSLQASDQSALVTGVAAIVFDCAPIVLNDGCNGNPASSPRQPGEKESGDAHRIYGFEGTPLLNIEPAVSAGKVETCQRLVLSVSDQTGQALGNENVDIHVSGPDDDVAFCDVEDGTDLRAPDQGGHTGGDENESIHSEGGADSHHAEAETKPNGDVVFGINSNSAGDSNIQAWLDRNDDDLVGGDETSDIATLHWRAPSKGGGKRCTQVGTSGRDILKGTPGRDVLCGRAGRDRIVGKRGNDVIIGGRGKDVLIGNGGRDTLRGARGNDVLRAGRGRDVLNGGAGNDRLNGGKGRDTCRGGTGRNRFKNCEKRR